MKHILTLLILLTVKLTYGQSSYPDFLIGTWKMENQDVYEHWDKLNGNTLKGFSYKLKDGQMVVSEYLDISKVNKEVVYTARDKGQGTGDEEIQSTLSS